MVSMSLRETMTGAAALLVAVAASAGAEPPIGSQAAAADEQRRLVARIEAEQSRNGPRSASLIEPLTALGLLYQESGDHGPAVTTIERTLQVLRANFGLRVLEQAPLLRQWIDNHEALGDYVAAWEGEQALLGLARLHSDDPRSAAVLREIADRRLQILERYVVGEQPPQVVGCFYDEKQAPGSCTSRTRSEVIRWMLSDIMRNYADAIAVLLRNGRYSSEELHDLELALVRSIDLVRHRELLGDRRGLGGTMNLPLITDDRLEPWRARVGAVVELAGWGAPATRAREPDEHLARTIKAARYSYVRGDYHALGRLGLRRLVTYAGLANDEAARVDALVQLADWDLLYSHSLDRSDSALAIYRRAYEELQEAGAPPSEIERIFAPQTPVVLPAFRPNPLATEAGERATGYIDVAFEITKHGKSRRVDVLEKTASVTHAERNRLVRLIKSSRFRPRMTDGRFADSTPVVVRYYVHD